MRKILISFLITAIIMAVLVEAGKKSSEEKDKSVNGTKPEVATNKTATTTSTINPKRSKFD